MTDLRYRQATTACLTAIVLMQVVNVHLCRSRRTSIVSRPLFGNALITAGIVAEVGLILAIDYTASGNAVFGTAAIGYEAWLVVLPFAAAMLALDEAQKAFVRWRASRALSCTNAAQLPTTVTPGSFFALARKSFPRFGKRIEEVPAENIAALQRYPWPGNIRELRNAVERAMTLASGPRLTVAIPRRCPSDGGAACGWWTCRGITFEKCCRRRASRCVGPRRNTGAALLLSPVLRTRTARRAARSEASRPASRFQTHR